MKWNKINQEANWRWIHCLSWHHTGDAASGDSFLWSEIQKAFGSVRTGGTRNQPLASLPRQIPLLVVALTDAAVIHRRVVLLGAAQQQRTVGRSRDFLRTDAGAVLHVGGVGGPDGQNQLRTLACCLPVPAEGGGVGGVGGVQQGALQGGVLPDSHLHGGGWQGGAVGALKTVKCWFINRRINTLNIQKTFYQ